MPVESVTPPQLQLEGVTYKKKYIITFLIRKEKP